MKVRSFKPFDESELKIIKEKNGTISLKELSVILRMNYGNLSTAMKQQKISWTSKKKGRTKKFKESSSMVRKKNDDGELLVTDEMIKSWFYQQ